MAHLTMADRRRVIRGKAVEGLFYSTTGAFADALTVTPNLTVGPFHPDQPLLDADGDHAIAAPVGGVRTTKLARLWVRAS